MAVSVSIYFYLRCKQSGCVRESAKPIIRLFDEYIQKKKNWLCINVMYNYAHFVGVWPSLLANCVLSDVTINVGKSLKSQNNIPFITKTLWLIVIGI